jgi:hypothetical protein
VRTEIIPARFWSRNPDRLAEVLASDEIPAAVVTDLWRFLERRDEPPSRMVVLVKYWERSEEQPPEMLVAE